MSEKLSQAAWDAALTQQGYHLSHTSRYGARLYVCEGKPSKRVSHRDPNMATEAWMKRTGVGDIRCSDDDIVPYPTGELPEFGLETDGDYHSDTSAITRGMLSVYMDSPIDFYYMYILGLKPRKARTRLMDFGLICHSILLEKKKIEEACEEYPYSCIRADGSLNGKKAREFEQSIYPRIAVKSDVIPKIRMTIKNARESEFGRLLDLHSDKAKYEMPITETVYGLPLKCRPDLHIVLSDQVIVPDLKFGAFLPDAFWRSARNFRYWLQQAHYTAILQQRYQLPVAWRFWAFETELPYRVHPYWYSDFSIEQSRDRHREAVRELKRSFDTGIWEDNFSSEGDLTPYELESRGRVSSEEEPTENNEYEERSYESDDDLSF